jgi:hypothetical protein
MICVLINIHKERNESYLYYMLILIIFIFNIYKIIMKQNESLNKQHTVQYNLFRFIIILNILIMIFTMKTTTFSIFHLLLNIIINSSITKFL